METPRFFHMDMKFLLVAQAPPQRGDGDISKSSDPSGLVALNISSKNQKPIPLES